MPRTEWDAETIQAVWNVIRNASKIRAWVQSVQAEVDRRIANHPDLAELDDYLDDWYTGRA